MADSNVIAVVGHVQLGDGNREEAGFDSLLAVYAVSSQWLFLKVDLLETGELGDSGETVAGYFYPAAHNSTEGTTKEGEGGLCPSPSEVFRSHSLELQIQILQFLLDARCVAKIGCSLFKAGVSQPNLSGAFALAFAFASIS